MPTIVLDDGHNSSGADTGAEGNGLREQDKTLDICQRIKPLLIANGFNVIMTRDGDLVKGLSSGYTLNQSLQARVDIANFAKADLFVSVHTNAFDGNANGIETHHAGSTNGKRFAGIMQYYLVQQSGMADRGLKESPNLYVLANTKMPAILTENGFIDHTEDAARLGSPMFLQAIAVAHAKGICDYYGQSYKESITPTPVPVSVPVGDKNAQAIELLNQAINILKG